MKKRLSVLLAIFLAVILCVHAVHAENVYYETTEDVNLRSGAGTNYGIVTTVPKGDVVEVTNWMLKEWWEVRYTNADNKTYMGYIQSQCLKETEKRSNEKKSSLPKTNLSSVKWDKKNKMVIIKWKKNTKGKGYELQFSKKKNFSKIERSFAIKKNSIVSRTLSGIPKGTYYVRIRTVKGKASSEWSKAKSVKVA